AGPYVLNLQLTPHQAVPQVVSVTRDDGIQPGASPARFVVQFSEPVNVQQLAFMAYQEYVVSGQFQLPGGFIQGPGPNLIFPRLENYDAASNTATFIMFDGLPSGAYQLHLSGANGLRDLADVPLAGNDPVSGDFVYSFTVHDPVRDSPNDPLLRV